MRDFLGEVKPGQLNHSQPQKNTLSQSTIRSFKSKQSLQPKTSVHTVKEYTFGRQDREPRGGRPGLKPRCGNHLVDFCVRDQKGKSKGRGKSKGAGKGKAWKRREGSKKPRKAGQTQREFGGKIKAKAAKKNLRKKKERFSLKEPTSGAKSIRERLLHQLRPGGRGKLFEFAEKRRLDTRSELLGNTADSLVLEKNNQSFKAKKPSLKQKIQGRLRGSRAERAQLRAKSHSRRPSQSRGREARGFFEKKGKKPMSQKQKFIEFQKRKIEKEIRSFHSLEPSKISNFAHREQEKSAQSSIKNDVSARLQKLHRQWADQGWEGKRVQHRRGEHREHRQQSAGLQLLLHEPQLQPQAGQPRP